MSRLLFVAVALLLTARPSSADVVTFNAGAGAIMAPCTWPPAPCAPARPYTTWYREGMMNVEGAFWLFGNAARQIQIDGNGQTFELGATYVFPEAGWRGISSFTWSMPKPPYRGYDYDDTAIIDNVVFTPVPEPVTLELLLAGIAAVAVRVRR